MKVICGQALAMLLIVDVGGCTSVPIRYQTLLSPEAVKPSIARPSLVNVDVRIGHIPAYVSRRELVIRGGPTEMTVLEDEHWASPLSEEIRDALFFDLESRLVANANASLLRSGTLHIQVDIERFEAVPGRYASIIAVWSATTSARAAEQRCRFSAHEPIGTTATDIASGYQQGLSELAAAIVQELKLTAEPDAECVGWRKSPSKGRISP
jgi:uncharacterized protein